MMVMCNRECKTTSLLVTSIAAMVVAILAKWVVVPLVIENQVYKNLELIEGTTGYDVWVCHFHKVGFF
jgi:predicted cobalt transporter CbtA